VRLTLLVLGAIAVVALLGVDPAVAAFLLDGEFLVLLGAVGLGLMGIQVRVLLHRVAVSTTAQYLRAGVAVTREDTRTLLAR
jgi:hypothetical protein